ncbi:MAG: IS4 family transposase [Prevotella sp.]|nr:IS4 family transposase [Bacteroidaceae bacterium]MBR6188553.1 IS4 family transposase [Prevotella sp.]
MQLEKLKVRAPEILRMIPDEELARLASDTKVDYCSKVLKGERMFYMLVYAMLCADRVSQRKLETVFSSAPFKTLFNFSVDMKVSHSSISSRFSKIDLVFFEKAYELIYNEFSALYTENEVRQMNLVRVDSSMVAETCNKLKEGFTVGKKPSSGESRRQAKYTVAYDGFGARLADVFFQPAYLSEDVAMPGVLMPLIKKDKDHMNLYVFDRGMSASANFSRISDEGAWFLGRIKTNRRMNVLRSLMTEGTGRNLGKLELVDDIVVHIFDDGGQEDMEHEYRVVKCRFKDPRDTERPKNKGKVKRVENEVYLITNHMGLTPQEIAEAYRRRWDIEVFFKFLKQELNFSHFLSTSENGIKVILYMTLITAMLIMIYKRKNEIGYSDAKFCFKLDMEEWIMELNFVIKGGDPARCNPRFIIRTRIP